MRRRRSRIALVRLLRWTPLWSDFSIFGNSHVAKLIVISPFVAQGVKYSEQFFREKLGLENVLWFYWSVILLAIGQLIYLRFAPTEIKKYGSNVERFKMESLSTFSNSEQDAVFCAFIRSFYKSCKGINKPGYDKPPISYSEKPLYDFPAMTREQFAEALEDDRLRGEDTRPHQYAVECAAALHRKNADVVVESWSAFQKVVTLAVIVGDQIDWECLNLLQVARPDLIGLSDLRKISGLDDRASADRKSWSLEALSWSFEKANRTNLFLRWVVFVLFLLGSVYFLNSVLRSLSEMWILTLASFNEGIP